MPVSGFHTRAAAALLAALLPFSCPLAWSAVQEPEAAAVVGTGIVPVVEDGKRIYLPSQFARFAPLTAADLAGQIPGFSVTSVSSNRGIGEATQNVLINGQRITGKGNDAMSVLRRIPVSAVIRLEIVDGAMLDISGLSGHVLDVLTHPDSVQGSFVWRPQIRERIPDHWPAGEVNLSGNSAIGDFTLGFRWDGFRGGGWGSETEYRPGTGETLVRVRDPRFSNDLPKLSGSLGRTLDSGSIWNVNASVDYQHFRRRVITQFQLPDDPLTTETSLGSNRKWRTEIGGDFEFALGAGRMKLVGLFSERSGPSVDEFTVLEDGATIPTGARFLRDSTEGERVGRAEFRWKQAGADWTLSGELAHNFVDADGSLETLDDAGEYQPVALPGASSRVEELRGESILSFSRPIGDGWTLQVSGGGEFSRLQQDGDDGQTRSFWRPKGSVSVAWNPASQWELNLKLQRKVSQLNFFDFLASVNLENNNANGANPELVPPQSWSLQLETIRSLGEHGKITLTAEAEDISDLVAQIPFGAAEEAPGNLPSARRLQLSINAGLLLDAVGVTGGRLDAYATIRDTRMRDPFTGEIREFNGNRYYWNLDFRHDVPLTSWTWGVFAEYQSTNHSYRQDFEEHFNGASPFAGIFLEHKDVLGLKVRASIFNLFRNPERTRQVSYIGDRDGPVEYTRDYPLEFGWIYRLQVSGTF